MGIRALGYPNAGLCRKPRRVGEAVTAWGLQAGVLRVRRKGRPAHAKIADVVARSVHRLVP